jgi:hypothetical protein
MSLDYSPDKENLNYFDLPELASNKLQDIHWYKIWSKFYFKCEMLTTTIWRQLKTDTKWQPKLIGEFK